MKSVKSQSRHRSPPAGPSTLKETCVAAATGGFHLRRCPDPRSYRLLQLVAEPARDETSSRDRPSGYCEFRAWRAVVLRLSHGRLLQGSELGRSPLASGGSPVGSTAGRVPQTGKSSTPPSSPRRSAVSSSEAVRPLRKDARHGRDKSEKFIAGGGLSAPRGLTRTHQARCEHRPTPNCRACRCSAWWFLYPRAVPARRAAICRNRPGSFLLLGSMIWE